MSINHYVLTFENDVVDANNYQLVDFDQDNATYLGTPEQCAAQLIAYVGALSGGFATLTRLTGITLRTALSPGAVPVVFPTTEYAAIRLDPDVGPWALPAWGGYGTNFGASDLCPLGTSISVSERTNQPGRTGRGRHFLPFTSVNTLDGAGAVNYARRVLVEDAWRTFIRAEGVTPLASCVNLRPVVTNHARTTNYEILDVKCQPIFSNLESRRR